MAAGGRTHIPRHDAARCERCGGCSWRCPASFYTELAAEEGSLRGALYTSRPFPGEAAKLPPCQLACPLGQDVPGYIAAIAQGALAEAGALIRRTNALPSVCGRVCLAACMRACTRAALDEGVDIRGLKRFAVVAAASAPPEARAAAPEGPAVAVIGGGPAGLSAAHRLLQLGLRPVIFEAAAQAGGLPGSVIPPFVLPRSQLAADVDALVQAGVEIRTGVRVGAEVAWQQVEADHAAVLLATGAGRGLLPSLPGRELSGVTHAVDFCRVACADPGRVVAGPVIVQGGGTAALLAARTARRLGAQDVRVVHTAPLALWPAGAYGIELAQEEGVVVLDAQRVVALYGEQGVLTEVACRAVRAGSLDGVGRPRPGGQGPPERFPAVLFIASVDRRAAVGAQPDLEDIATTVLGAVRVDGDYRLSRPRWYAAGEAATGAATVVDSMATGRRAAEAIARDLDLNREAL